MRRAALICAAVVLVAPAAPAADPAAQPGWTVAYLRADASQDSVRHRRLELTLSASSNGRPS